jgi:hypothetical protein
MSLRRAVGITSLCALLLPATARAQLTTKLAAVGAYQYNSNVYDVQSGFAIPGTCAAVPFGPATTAQCPASDFHYGDSYYSYGSELDLNELYSQQNWFLTAAITHFTYDHFTDLDHNEYHLDGGWKWRLDGDWYGTLEVTRSRTMVAFTEIIQVELAVATDQRETALVGVEFMPDWRLEASGFTHKVDEPLLGEPNLSLTESSGGLALTYGGQTGLTGGMTTNYTHGSYSNPGEIPTIAFLFLTPAYDQTSVALTATYQPTAPSALPPAGGSTFDGAVGWSNRTFSGNLANISGVTGHLDYTNQLTGKTSVKVALDRVISSYLTNAASEIDTAASLSALWQATYRIGVTPAYTWTYRFLPDQGFIPGTDRSDHLQYASLIVDYAVRPWLDIRPYANWQTRRSTYYGANFNATVYGATVTVTWQHPPP